MKDFTFLISLYDGCGRIIKTKWLKTRHTITITDSSRVCDSTNQ